MKHDHLAVRRTVDVELYGIRAMLERQQKAFQGVFAPFPWRSAMCNAFEPIAGR